MKWLALAAAILVAASSPAFAADKQSAQKLLDSAHSPADLFQHATSPFDLEVDFDIPSDKTASGHLALQWQSKDHWRSKVTFANFAQITVLNGEQQYTWGSLDFIPPNVGRLYSLLSLMESLPPSGATVSRVKNRTVDGVSLTCMRTEQGDQFHSKREICIDPNTHTIVRVELTTKFEKQKSIYSGYFDFEGQSFPRNLELDDERGSITARVNSLQPAAFPGDLLTPAPGTIMRRKCPGMVPPMAIFTHDPEPGKDFDSKGLTGALALIHVTVLPDGSVTDIKVVSSDNSGFAAASVAEIAKWRFKPATCGNEPVVTDITVESRYRGY